MSEENYPDMSAGAESTASAAMEQEEALMTWRVIVVVVVIVVSTTLLARSVYRRQNKQQGEADEVDEIFTANNRKITKESLGELIAATHTEIHQMAEAGEMDLDEFGASAWPDMPNTILVAIMEELLILGTGAIDAEDHEGAVLAFTEALTLEASARPEGTTLKDCCEPLQSVAFRLLLHRAGAHRNVGNEEAAQRDDEAAKHVYDLNFAAQPADSVDEND